MEKIDPDLQLLIAAHAEGRLPASPNNPAFLTHVYVVVDSGDFGGLQAAGHTLYEADDDTAIIVLPIDQIETLAARDDVSGVYAPMRADPTEGDLEYTGPQRAVNLDDAAGVLTRPGEEVYVGIVDSGVCILHDAFRTPPPDRKTRIKALWIQDDYYSEEPAPALWKKHGVTYDDKEIDKLLVEYDAKKATGKTMADALVALNLVKGVKATANTADKRKRAEEIAPKLLDISGIAPFHGTKAASVAVGTPWRVYPSLPKSKTLQGGIAPDAKIIAVALENDFISGALFCFATAGTTPCVVNMSLGSEDMPHNGRTVFDEMTAKRIKGKPAALVVAAGNNGRIHGHARVKSSESNLGLDVPTGHKSFRIFVTSESPLEIEIAPPGLAFAGDDGTSDGHTISIKPFKARKGDNDKHYKIKVTGKNRPKEEVKNGGWIIKFGGSSDRIDAWLVTDEKWPRFMPRGQTRAAEDSQTGHPDPERVDPLPTHWRRPPNWIQHTVAGTACGEHSITVGTYEASGSKVRVLYSSSRGPAANARAGAKQKPDLAAPNWELFAAKTEFKGAEYTSSSTYFGGTSAAAPVVAGTIALMFSQNKKLTDGKVREIMGGDKGTEPLSADTLKNLTNKGITNPSEMFGAGTLDIKKAVDEAIRLK